jgi:hypothetical protein
MYSPEPKSPAEPCFLVTLQSSLLRVNAERFKGCNIYIIVLRQVVGSIDRFDGVFADDAVDWTWIKTALFKGRFDIANAIASHVGFAENWTSFTAPWC